ncbi:MAG TPA: 4Fe-4S binding protein [Syntrophales bacterium]|nr:4Fe-4S binding protein [Syntrophales bacterium]
MKTKRKIIRIDEKKCDGCGACVPACAEGAIQIVNGKAKLVAEIYCDGLGACLGECPKGALKIIERQADEFDEAAVEERMKSKKSAHVKEMPVMACGCPSSQIVSFASLKTSMSEGKPAARGKMSSVLSHWPVQIRLAPPTAPFLKKANILVLADCTAVAYPHLHGDFLKGKAVLMGCPKFDETEIYVERFAQIFAQADIKSVTVLVMEVPCCQGLPLIIMEGMKRAGKNIPVEKVVIGRTGEILKKESLEG